MRPSIPQERVKQEKTEAMALNFYETDLGRIGIAETRGSITNVYFETDDVPHDVEISETALIKEAARQLDRYFAGELREFSLPLEPAGTSFMQAVWKLLLQIPYGQTASYKQIAASLGNPLAVRAVGLANNRNPIPIFIPCHRIIGSGGKLIGYRGGLALKKRLLDLERGG
jgi:methylated-DNA-[protein]-cysteine S-methyltransferase